MGQGLVNMSVLMNKVVRGVLGLFIPANSLKGRFSTGYCFTFTLFICLFIFFRFYNKS